MPLWRLFYIRLTHKAVTPETAKFLWRLFWWQVLVMVFVLAMLILTTRVDRLRPLTDHIISFGIGWVIAVRVYVWQYVGY